MATVSFNLETLNMLESAKRPSFQQSEQTKNEVTNEKLTSMPDVSFNLETHLFNMLENPEAANFQTGERHRYVTLAPIYFCSDAVKASGVFSPVLVPV